MSKGTNTTTTSTAPNQDAMLAYQQLLGTAQGTVNQNPFQTYGGQFVAPLTGEQYGGIGGINQYANAAQPGLSYAQMLAAGAAHPISAGQIAQYENPYTQQVVGATEAQFNNQNAQQQQQLLANAAGQGALGGDRAGVAQAALAGQQNISEAPVIAGLESQGYTQGVQTALAEQQAQAQGAYGVGSLAQAAQQAGLTGAGAQIQAGTLEQQTQQAQDAALYNQFLMQQAFPYQQEQWLAGIDTGVGSQMGGTSQTTGPPPSILAQILGLGTAGLGAAGQAGLFKPSARGGRIGGFAYGGVPATIGQPLYGNVSGVIPAVQLTRGKGAPTPPTLPGSNATQMAQDAKNIASSFKNAYGSGPSTSGGLVPDSAPNTGPYETLPDEALARGGYVRGYDDGGEVAIIHPNDMAPLTYGPGAPAPPKAAPSQQGGLGNLVSDIPWGKIAAGLGAAAGAIGSAASSIGGGEAGAVAGALLAKRGGIVDRLPRHNRIEVPTRAGFGLGSFMPQHRQEGGDVVEIPAEDMPQDVPQSAVDAWRQGRDLALSSGEGGLGVPSSALPFTGTNTGMVPVAGLSATPVADRIAARYGQGQQPVTVQPGIGQSVPWSSAQSNIWPSLMAAGFGMMASRSPFPGVAIGEGGLRGLQTYQGLGQEQRAEVMSQQKINQAADQLALHAEQVQKNLALQTQEVGLKQRQVSLAEQVPHLIGQESVFDPATGGIKTKNVYGVRADDGKWRDALTGKVVDPSTLQTGPGVMQPPGVFAPPGARSAPVAAAPAAPASEWPAFAAGGAVKRQDGGDTPPPPVQPVMAPGSGGLFGIPGENSNLTGDDYLSQFSPSFQAAVKDYVAGRSMPLSNPRAPAVAWVKRAAEKYGQDIGQPVDDSVFNARRSYRTQFGSAQPNSVGGQRNLLSTSLGHLADVAQRAEALNNWTGPNVPGGKYVGQAMNVVRGSSPEQAALVSALDTAAQRYGGEVEKLYAGSRGTMTERAETQGRYSGTKTPLDYASSLGTDLDLMHAKLSELENQKNMVMGPNNAQELKFLTPNAYHSIDVVQGAINRMRGINADQRAKQLQASGLPQEQINGRLHAEGYSMPDVPTPPAKFDNGLRSEAEVAIRSGAPRDKVLQRLQAQGIDPTGL